MAVNVGKSLIDVIADVIFSAKFAWILCSILWFHCENLRSSQSPKSVTKGDNRMAIVIPFIEDELPQIENNFAQWTTQFWPCSHGKVNKKVDLVLYYNNDWAHNTKLLNRLQKMVQGNKAIKQCFRNVRYLMANLPPKTAEDRYPLGSSIMFFRAMELPGLVDEYSYMMWMEVDDRPCRRGWLDAAYKLALKRDDFWMLGSIVRDGQQSNTYYSFADHLNGNAIYRLDDPLFHEFLSKVQDEFSKNKGRFLSAFDIAIYLVARHTLPFSEYAAMKHRFQYTQFIQNVYRANVTMKHICESASDTYFVHGRHVTI